MQLSWISVSGGICRYGDRSRLIEVPTLEWSRTLITQGQVGRSGARNLPLTCISYAEALHLAAEIGGRLPRSVEWEWMAAGSERRQFPWGDRPWTALHANIFASRIGGPSEVGAHLDGATPTGLVDVAGNAWEWTSTPVLGNGFIIRGGSYRSPLAHIHTRFLNAAPMELRSPGIGFRVVRAA